MRRHSSACDTRPEVICVWLLGAVWWPWMAKLSHRQPDTHDTSAQVGRGAVGFSTRVQRHERAIGSTSNRRHARARAHSCGAHSRPPCVRTIAGVRLTQTPTPWAPACRPPAVWAGRHAGHGCQGSAVQRRPPPPRPRTITRAGAPTCPPTSSGEMPGGSVVFSMKCSSAPGLVPTHPHLGFSALPSFTCTRPRHACVGWASMEPHA